MSTTSNTQQDSDWQLIETAPRDGTWVHVKYEDGEALAHYHQSDDRGYIPAYQGWFIDSSIGYVQIHLVTHWLPASICRFCKSRTLNRLQMRLDSPMSPSCLSCILVHHLGVRCHRCFHSPCSGYVLVIREGEAQMMPACAKCLPTLEAADEGALLLVDGRRVVKDEGDAG